MRLLPLRLAFLPFAMKASHQRDSIALVDAWRFTFDLPGGSMHPLPDDLTIHQHHRVRASAAPATVDQKPREPSRGDATDCEGAASPAAVGIAGPVAGMDGGARPAVTTYTRLHSARIVCARRFHAALDAAERTASERTAADLRDLNHALATAESVAVTRAKAHDLLWYDRLVFGALAAVVAGILIGTAVLLASHH